MIKLTPIEPNFVNLSSSAPRCCLEVVSVKVAVVGSRSLAHLQVDFILPYIPEDATEIVSGGARGVDQMAVQLADKRGVPCWEYLPDYARYGRGAPLVRNREIVKQADLVLAVWDGKSRGTRYVMDQCKKTGTALRVFRLDGSPYLPAELCERMGWKEEAMPPQG